MEGPDRKEYFRSYYQKNRDRLLAYQRKRYKEDPEIQRRWQALHPRKRVAQDHEYYTRHRERIRERDRRYAHSHPEVGQIKSQNRRSRKRGYVSLAEWRAILAVYKHRCAYCGKKSEKLTQDHVVPLAKGGLHEISNIVPACRSCNSRKSTKAPTVPVKVMLF